MSFPTLQVLSRNLGIGTNSSKASSSNFSISSSRTSYLYVQAQFS
ncbi:9289_t:CDS:2, partial [Gigaspora margarita]